MITLDKLKAALGEDLLLVAGTPGLIAISGVHISELDDPTAFLDGAELLLTTGIPLAHVDIDDYVARLARHGVAALALGLGAGIDDVPAGLTTAADRHGLVLFAVPSETPFLRISRAYWDLVGRTEQAELSSRLGLQSSLVRAAAKQDARLELVHSLAEGLRGWVGYLPADGSPATVWPESAQDYVPQLREEADRFDMLGSYTAASFAIRGMSVVLHSIRADGDIVGLLAVGAGRMPRREERSTIVTACLLLGMLAAVDSERSQTAAVVRRVVVDLVLEGQVAAALSASHRTGANLPEPCRVLVSRGDAPRGALGVDRGQFVIDLVGVDHHERPSAGGAAIISAPLELDRVAEHLGRLEAECLATALGSVRVIPGPVHGQAAEWVAALAGYSRADLVTTVRTYLRYRGQWEGASRDLAIHRNSLRHRMAIAEGLIGRSIDDADTAAELWIALRDG